MVRPYLDGNPDSLRDLITYFPDVRPPPAARCFEFSVAAAGGVSTGAYVAGVVDFLIEALDAFAAAKDANQDGAPRHEVRLTNLSGTSAGGLSVALAATCLLKQAPHVYHEKKWSELVAARLASGDQRPQENPLYAAWVQQADLTKLLAAPQRAETELSLFASAPTDIAKTVLQMLSERDGRPWPRWAAEPLDLRILIGNLRGVPYSLDFANMPHLAYGERLILHRDNIAFSLSRHGDPGAPDAYELAGETFNTGAAWSMFQSAAIASSAIPAVFAPTPVNDVDLAVYQWRDCHFDTRLRLAVLNQPSWQSPPPGYSFTATDGGVFDNEPFDVAHAMLSGVRSVNPRDGACANRAVILVAPVVNELAADPRDPVLADTPAGGGGGAGTPLSRLIAAMWSIFNSPIEQSRWDAFDLALAKSEAVFSRFMISPSRESPNPATPVKMLGPSKSLMGLPLNQGLGFAAEAYRRHDFLLGRRNAQKFLTDSFMLPSTNPIIDPCDTWEATEIKFVPDPKTAESVAFYPIIPLRGTARRELEEPLPEWHWQALTPDRIDRVMGLFGARLDAIWRKVVGSVVRPATSGGPFSRVMSGMKNALIVGLAALAWRAWLRKALSNRFEGLLVRARDELDPRNL